MTPMTIMRGLLAGGALCVAFSLPAAAQVQSTQTEAHGTPTHEVTVQRGEIVAVEGNDVVIKMEDGTLRHFANVPESTTVTVDGKQLNVHQIKPGMKIEKQTITTTTPKMVTTVETVTGTVWHVSPPNSVVLTLENGKNQSFKIPKGQKFMVDGQETDAWGLKKGMKVAATKIVEEPITVAEHEQQVTGSMPPPPPPPPADAPILVAVAAPPPPVASAPPAELPKTGSVLPLIGFLGCISFLSSIGMAAIRKGL